METKVIQNMRCLAADMVQKASSGHPGAPMGLAPLATILWGEVMNFDPQDPKWHNRDRFVLSNGHGCALQYMMLHLCDYGCKMEDLKQFRQIKSRTPGHPERDCLPGVEVTTGPLGQGFSNAVGMAIAEAHQSATYNKGDLKVVDHYTYVIAGDGCLMEGVGQEAASMAGHMGLEKLILIYDDNHISIDGDTACAYTEDPAKKFEALGWRVIVVKDGNNDMKGMRDALAEARKHNGKPTMIQLRTTIGKDAEIENTGKVHGAPLGEDGVKALKKKYGRDEDKTFVVDDEVYKYFEQAGQRGKAKRAEWQKVFEKYKQQHPEEYKKYEAAWNGQLPDGWKDKLPRNSKAVATRKASEGALGVLMPLVPWIIGGSADLTGSNCTRPDAAKLVDFQKDTPEGRYLRFGVREHAMIGALNGIHAHGGLVAFGGTFLNFVSYAMGSVRLAALSGHHSIIVATHDSIGLGEDGPTHQPIETMAALRSMPNMVTLRPSDQTETSAAWAIAMERRTGPTCLVLSRQGADPIEASDFDAVEKGAYTVLKCDKPKLIIASSGTEVSMSIAAAKLIGDTRVVSMPSWELFEAQTTEYKQQVFPQGVPVLSVEPYARMGWERYAHAHFSIDKFGESAPAADVYKHFHFSPEAIASKGKKLVEACGGNAPRLGPVIE